MSLLCDHCESAKAIYECGKCHIQVYCSENCQRADFHQHSADCHDIDEVCLDSLRSELENHPDPIAEEILQHFDNDDFHAIQAGICLVGLPTIGKGRRKKTWKRATPTKRTKKGRGLFKRLKGRKRRKPLVSTKTKAKAAAAAGGAALLFG